jgi:hypothetical protein
MSTPGSPPQVPGRGARQFSAKAIYGKRRAPCLDRLPIPTASEASWLSPTPMRCGNAWISGVERIRSHSSLRAAPSHFVDFACAPYSAFDGFLGVAWSVEESAFEQIECASRGIETERAAFANHDTGDLRLQFDDETLRHKSAAAGVDRPGRARARHCRSAAAARVVGSRRGEARHDTKRYAHSPGSREPTKPLRGALAFDDSAQAAPSKLRSVETRARSLKYNL